MTTSGFGSAPWGLFAAGEGLEDMPPYVGAWQPFAGDVIGRLGTVEFEVTDDYGLVDVRVNVVFPAGVIESVWTETLGFASLYKRGSARLTIDGGYHYVLRRTTGWPMYAVRIDVTATDLAGNVGTGQASFP